MNATSCPDEAGRDRRKMKEKKKKERPYISTVSHNIRKTMDHEQAHRSLKVQLESFPLSSHRPAPRTPSCSGITRRPRRHTVHSTITRASELSRRTRDEHANTFTTDTTDAFRTGVALIQCPGTLTIGAVDLNLFVAERSGSGVRETVVLSLGDGRN